MSDKKSIDLGLTSALDELFMDEKKMRSPKSTIFRCPRSTIFPTIHFTFATTKIWINW